MSTQSTNGTTSEDYTLVTVEGILFDMDGTLVDSTAAVEKTMGDWATKQGITPEFFFSHSHGVRTRDNVRRFQTVPVKGEDLTEEELIKTVTELEESIAESGRLLGLAGGRGIDPLPGMHTLLEALKAGGARFGVVTSATAIYATSALKTAKVVDLPFRITGDQCTHGKPHPEPFLKGKSSTPSLLARVEALRQLPGPPITSASNVLVFEDAPSGLKAGLAAGCQTLAVCTSHSRDQIRAIDATYRVVDLTRVEVVTIDKEKGTITLRLKTLEKEEEEAK
ncbi:hypothetical protein RQP46_005736 [Phenoliferia psychrophenolica]